MTKNRIEQIGRRFLWVFLITLLMVAALAAVFDFYYDLNDDTTIKDIISGAYTGTPSGYSIQMLYPLSALLALCYRAIPGIAWYGLFLCLCQFGSFFLIAWRTFQLVENKKKQVLSIVLEALLFAGVLIRQLVIVQYSVTAGICMATAIFLYVTSAKKQSASQELWENLPALLLVLLSFLIRTEMCLMLCPFLALAGVSRWLSEEGKGWRVFRKYVVLAATAFLAMLALYQLDNLSYYQAQEEEDWSGFLSYFDARTKLYDFYEIPDYDSHLSFYEEIGLSRESYQLLQNYNFALDDSIDEHLLEAIVTYQESQADAGGNLHRILPFLYTKNTLKEAVWLYRRHLTTGADGTLGLLLLACYVLYIFCGMGEKKGGMLYARVAALLLIRSALWMYLFLVDRVLDRITVPLLLAELVLLLSWLLQDWNERVRQLAKVVLAMGAFALLIVNGRETYAEYQAREEVNSRWEALISFCRQEEEDFFLIDVYSSTSYQGVPYAEKIFQNVDNSFKNFDICGGWLAKSPLSRQKLEQRNLTDVETALYPGEEQQTGQTYFIAADKELDWLISYYAYKGKQVILDRVYTIYDEETPVFFVYSLVENGS